VCSRCGPLWLFGFGLVLAVLCYWRQFGAHDAFGLVSGYLVTDHAASCCLRAFFLLLDAGLNKQSNADIPAFALLLIVPSLRVILGSLAHSDGVFFSPSHSIAILFLRVYFGGVGGLMGTLPL